MSPKGGNCGRKGNTISCVKYLLVEVANVQVTISKGLLRKGLMEKLALNRAAGWGMNVTNNNPGLSQLKGKPLDAVSGSAAQAIGDWGAIESTPPYAEQARGGVTRGDIT